MDLITQLGPLAFASRLKRLADRLMKDVSQLYKDLDLEFEARWFPVVYYLKERDSVPLTTVAQDLGLTHPAVNQVANVLSEKGLLASTRDTEDERRRLLSLTQKGRDTVRTLEPVWEEIAAATADVIAQSGTDILTALRVMEATLDDTAMYDRVRERLRARDINVFG